MASTENESCRLPLESSEFGCEYLNPLGDEPQALVGIFVAAFRVRLFRCNVGAGEDGIGNLAAGAIRKKQFARRKFRGVFD
jgi:hypothetical protein